MKDPTTTRPDLAALLARVRRAQTRTPLDSAWHTCPAHPAAPVDLHPSGRYWCRTCWNEGTRLSLGEQAAVLEYALELEREELG